MDFLIELYKPIPIQSFMNLFILNMQYFKTDNDLYKNHLIEVLLVKIGEDRKQQHLSNKAHLELLFEIMKLMHHDYMRLSKQNQLYLSLDLDTCLSQM